MSQTSEFEVRPLDQDHDRAAFSCEVPSLEQYLKTQASQDFRRDMALPWVMSEPGKGTIIGYYTLTNCGIDAGDVPEEIRAQLKLPKRHEFPAVLLGRFAIASSHSGRGFGQLLFTDVQNRVLQISKQSATSGIYLHAENTKSAGFWRKMEMVSLGFGQNGKEGFFQDIGYIRDLLG